MSECKPRTNEKALEDASIIPPALSNCATWRNKQVGTWDRDGYVCALLDVYGAPTGYTIGQWPNGEWRIWCGAKMIATKQDESSARLAAIGAWLEARKASDVK